MGLCGRVENGSLTMHRFQRGHTAGAFGGGRVIRDTTRAFVQNPMRLSPAQTSVALTLAQ